MGIKENEWKGVHITPNLIVSEVYFEEIVKKILILSEHRLAIPHVVVSLCACLDSPHYPNVWLKSSLDAIVKAILRLN